MFALVFGCFCRALNRWSNFSISWCHTQHSETAKGRFQVSLPHKMIIFRKKWIWWLAWSGLYLFSDAKHLTEDQIFTKRQMFLASSNRKEVKVQRATSGKTSFFYIILWQKSTYNENETLVLLYRNHSQCQKWTVDEGWVPCSNLFLMGPPLFCIIVYFELESHYVARAAGLWLTIFL